MHPVPSRGVRSYGHRKRIGGLHWLPAASPAVLALVVSLATATGLASLAPPALGGKLAVPAWSGVLSLVARGADLDLTQPEVSAQVSRTFTVNSDGDEDDSSRLPDGLCSTSSGCTLRAAITEANATPDADTIHFNIPCQLLRCVQPVINAGTLLTITRPVTIDGTTQPTERGQIAGVRVNGGLDITGGSSVVRGLHIRSTIPIKLSGGGASVGGNTLENNTFEGAGAGITVSEAVSIVDSSNNVIQNNRIISAGFGVLIRGLGARSNTNRVRGNTIGRAESGSAATDANGVGVSIGYQTFPADPSPANGNIIENNVISGNASHGMHITGINSAGNLVGGNKIGVNTDGSGPLGNGGDGVFIEGAPGSWIGPTGTAGRNIIAANKYGVRVSDSGGSQDSVIGTRITGNYIGPNAIGTIPIIPGNTEDGIAITNAAESVTVDGNVISWNSSYGIRIQGSAGGNHQISGNFIGTNATGTAAMPNGNDAIWITGQNNHTIGPNNVIAATSGRSGIRVAASGVRVFGNRIGTNAAGTEDISSGGGISSTQAIVIGGTLGTTPGGPCSGDCNLVSGSGGIDVGRGSRIVGNYVGTDVTGMIALGNAGEGILAGSNSVIGGTSPEARNIISGNSSYGLLLLGGGSAVQGNYIGVGTDGSRPLPNAEGIEITTGVGEPAGTNTIGGAEAGARNVISGNTGAGIVVVGGQTAQRIEGNVIGTNAAGTLAVPNAQGIILYQSNNTIGSPGAGKVISGNTREGLVIDGQFTPANGNLVQGNFIGTRADGSTPLGNGLHGVWVRNASNNRIGGTSVSAGNLIAFSGQDGVFVEDDGQPAEGNAILSNSIHSNGGLGIDLSPNGVTANDAGDADPGANKLQNFPVLTSATLSGVQGTLGSTANTNFTIQAFSNASCDPSGNGEGQTLIGSAAVTTDATGNATFSLNTALVAGQAISATATDPDGNTSEFSACLTVSGAPAATSTPTQTPTPTMTSLTPAPITPTATPRPGLGGVGFGITPSDSVTMTWSPGSEQTGYLIVRITASGGVTILPLAGILPPAATLFTDTVGLTEIGCYVLVVLGPGSSVFISDVLCLFPNTRVGNFPRNFTIRLNQSSTASFTWDPPTNGGQTRYVLTPLGSSPINLHGSVTSTSHTMAGVTCYTLAAATDTATLGTTDMLCGIPGIATLGDQAGSRGRR